MPHPFQTFSHLYLYLLVLQSALPLLTPPLLLLMCDYQIAALQSEIDRSADMYKLPLMMCLSGQIAGVSRQALHLQRSSGSSVLGYQAQIHTAHCHCLPHYQLEDFY